jgi:hypothetical protein
LQQAIVMIIAALTASGVIEDDAGGIACITISLIQVDPLLQDIVQMFRVFD